MDFSTIDLDALIPKLEDRRVSLNLSYQNVADACNVSQSTIIRIFKRQADPSIVVLRSILAAVKYDIVTPPIFVVLAHKLCFFFGYDIANLDRGWIQARSASGGLLK